MPGKHSSPLTFSEFRKFSFDTLRLALWFVWSWKHSHINEPIADILRNRVDIFRKTALNSPEFDQDAPPFEMPEWLELEKRVSEIFDQASSDQNKFVESAVDVFTPLIEDALEDRWRRSRDFSNMKCGSLTYNAPSPDQPNVIAIHIANALQPRSIFDDPEYLPTCLLKFMDMTEEEYGVDTIHCGSWLNSHPRWLALFPKEYSDSLSEPDKNIQWHFGFWGQFINARGGFHAKNAEKFRNTGNFPFAFRTADCSFKSLREHLKQLKD